MACNLRRARISLVTASFCRGDKSMVAVWPDPLCKGMACETRLNTDIHQTYDCDVLATPWQQTQSTKGVDLIVSQATLSAKGMACKTDHKDGRCNPLLCVNACPHITHTCVSPQQLGHGKRNYIVSCPDLSFYMRVGCQLLLTITMTLSMSTIYPDPHRNPEIQSKMVQIWLKYPANIYALITSPNLQGCARARILFDVIAITSTYNDLCIRPIFCWVLFRAVVIAIMSDQMLSS